MYSDCLFNFSEIIENEGEDRGAVILSRMAVKHPFFGLDCGVRQGDIWQRAAKFRNCVSLLVNENEKQTINNMIYFSTGIMPDSDSVENRFQAVETLEETIKDFKSSDDEYAEKLVAIGPCGIDHDWDSVEFEGRDHEYFDHSTMKDEKDLFALQVTLAKKLDMPIIVHSRKGYKDTEDVLKAIKWNKGVIHGFSYTQSELETFLNLGWYISFSGTVTYAGKKNFQDMADIVSYVPKDRILIESDSPYYAPVPVKNQSNSPDYINYIYEYIAAKRNINLHKLSDIVDENCKKLFKLK